MGSKDTLAIVSLLTLIIAGGIAAFQISDLPPGTNSLVATLTNPFGLLSLLGLVGLYYAVIKS